MTIMDDKLVLSDAQAETTIAEHDSDFTIDFGDAVQKPGIGTPLWLNITVNEVVAGTSSTVTFKVQDSADDITFVSIFETPDIAEAVLVKGHEVLRIPLPHTVRQYLKVVYEIKVAVLTTGKFDAWIDMTGQMTH